MTLDECVSLIAAHSGTELRPLMGAFHQAWPGEACTGSGGMCCRAALTDLEERTVAMSEQEMRSWVTSRYDRLLGRG